MSPARLARCVRRCWAGLVVAAALLAVPPAEAKLDSAAEDALAFLSGRAATSGPLAANIAEAAAANGLDPAAWPPSDPIAGRIVVPGEGASNISLLRPLRALALAGDPRAAPDGELTRRVASHLREDGYGDPRTLNDDAYAVLALSAASPIDDGDRWTAVRQHLRASQNDDGGWGWSVGGTSGTDTTGLVVEALSVAGGAGSAGAQAGRALAFLDATRHADGGYAETPGGQPNCESTVWGIRASARLGRPAVADDWDFLLGLQRADGGFAHLAGGRSDLLCTTEVASLLGEGLAGRIAMPVVQDQGPADPRGIPGLSVPLTAVALVATVLMSMSTRVRHP